MSYKWILTIVAVLAVSYFVYLQLPNLSALIGIKETVQTTDEISQPANLTISESNPRWNHFPLKIFIDTGFPNYKSSYKNDVKAALTEWTNAVSFATFEEVSNSENSDIAVRWVNKLAESSKDTIGNTDLKFLDTDRFKIIQSAEIQLLTKEEGRELTGLDMTNLAMHEIGHALGLDHNDLKDSVMYPKLNLPSASMKQISVLDTSTMKQIYKLPAKPDLILSKGNATKFTISNLVRTRYFLNVSITVENQGISTSQESALKTVAGNETIKTTSIPSLEVGSKYFVFLGNLEVSGNFSSADITVDPNNLVDELDESNNKIILKIS